MHKTLIGLCFVGLLAGCSGNTYGTGVSSEKQLLNDVTGIVRLGRTEKKERIDYASRPTLIRPPVVAQLPAPAETIKSESGYFPEDPETRHKRLLAELEEADTGNVRTDNLSPELQAMRADSLARKRAYGATPTNNIGAVNSDGDCFICDYYVRTNRDKKHLAEKTAKRQQVSVQKRRYLTEPPDDYRKPAETAEAGVLGEEELSQAAIARNKRKKKSIFDRIFGG